MFWSMQQQLSQLLDSSWNSSTPANTLFQLIPHMFNWVHVWTEYNSVKSPNFYLIQIFSDKLWLLTNCERHKVIFQNIRNALVRYQGVILYKGVWKSLWRDFHCPNHNRPTAKWKLFVNTNRCISFPSSFPYPLTSVWFREEKMQLYVLLFKKHLLLPDYWNSQLVSVP